MKLHLIRHPKPKIAAGLCYGQTDVPLQDAVAPHATRLKALLPESFALYSSPLSRALSLANALGTPVIDDRLQEMNFGLWEQKRFDDFSEQVHAWAQDPLGFQVPGGETGLQVAARIWSFHQDLWATQPSPDIVVVGHSGPFRLWITQALGLDLEKQHLFQLDFAKLTRMSFEKHAARLLALNL